jgi:FHA domain
MHDFSILCTPHPAIFARPLYANPFSRHVVEADFDFENNPEFEEFIKKNNPTNETLLSIQKALKSEIDYGFGMTTMAFEWSLRKVRSEPNGAKRPVRSDDAENRVPSKADAKITHGKRSIRNSVIKPGKTPGTIIRQPTGQKRVVHKNEINTILSQELEEKATVSTANQQEISNHVFDDAVDPSKIPKGKVRIEVLSDVSGESPHVGEVRLVEPKANMSQRCKIGRGIGKEYSEFGFSLHKDLEVSTKHGFLTRAIKSKNVYEYLFVDVGSSNGTYDVENNVRLEKNVPYKLQNGMKLLMGKSTLQFHF